MEYEALCKCGGELFQAVVGDEYPLRCLDCRRVWQHNDSFIQEQVILNKDSNAE